MFAHLARLADRRPWRVLLIALVVAIAAGTLGGSVAKRLGPYQADDPATESVQASDRLAEASGVHATPSLVALVDTGADLRAPAARAKVRRVERALRSEPLVAATTTYLRARDPAMVSRDGRSTYVVAQYRSQPDTAEVDVADSQATDRLEQRVGRIPGVRLGGPALASKEVNDIVGKDLARAELLAFPILFLLSFWFFRGVVAALLPPLVGGLSILGTFLAIRVASEFVSLSVFALNLITGLGLGLAIDYSLFVVSRYREELVAGGSRGEVLARTLGTAGRTVLFSSITVAAALAALLIFPQRFLYSMGLGGLLVALVAASVALLVLPALLALLGERVNAGSPAWLKGVSERDSRPATSGAWYRLSRLVMVRPGRVAAASAALLVALGIPFLGIRFTSVDSSVLPESTAARQVDERLDRDFPPHRTEPIVVAVDARPGAQTEALARRIRALPVTAAVSPARPVGAGLSRIDVYSRAPFLDERSQALVRQIRNLPAGARVQVAGATAGFVDQKSSLARHLPWAVLVVALATLVVLFLMTGSVVLPLKALVMNLLTLSAAFGILVLVFQHGRLEGVLGYTSQGALESSQPVLLFALAFGLSTDYGVFLLSRIKEARDRGAPDSEAVAIGLERTGRIVTAAALLFCVAIGAFATSRIIFIKEVGLGTALAVLIDATIVRALLVPSLMELLGHRNWWAPPLLRRLHARLGLSEGPPPQGPARPLSPAHPAG